MSPMEDSVSLSPPTLSFTQTLHTPVIHSHPSDLSLPLQDPSPMNVLLSFLLDFYYHV